MPTADTYACLPTGLDEGRGDREETAPSLLELAKDNVGAQWRAKARKKKKSAGSMRRNGILKRSILRLKDTCSFCHCSKSSCYNFLHYVFPFVRLLKGYSGLYDFPCDIIAGLTVGIMHIPQGMAYALLTQLPPVYGLYTSFYPVIIYFLFGSSKHISVGTFAVVSLMVGAVVDRGYVRFRREELLHPNNNMSLILIEANVTSPVYQKHMEDLDEIKVAYAMSVTFAVGIMQVLLGVLRLGFLTTFLSDPLISGFTTGTAIHVFSSQIQSAFGVTIGRYNGPFKLIYAYRDFFANIDQINFVTMTATIVAVLAIIFIKEGINNNKSCRPRMKVPIPIELLVIIGGTLLSHFLNLNSEFNVEVVGELPRGLPKPDVTKLRFFPELIGEAFAICFTAFAISFSMAKILADKHFYEINPNQELVAHGMCNVLGPIFSAFCSSASLSRSMVQENVGGKTQVSSLISGGLVIIVLLSMGPLFKALPNCILAAIILVSLKGLFTQIIEARRLWKVSKIDFTVWLVVFVATVLLDVDLGLLVGLVYNLVPVLLRTQRAYSCLLGNLAGTEAYMDKKVYPGAKDIPGIKIFRFEAPLYFANMEHFRRQLIRDTGLDPQELKRKKDRLREADVILRHHQVCLDAQKSWPDVPCTGLGHEQTKSYMAKEELKEEIHAIVIDGSTIQYVDSVTVKVLFEIVQSYKDVDIDIYLGECKGTVRSMLEKSGFYTHIHRRHVCATIHHAVMCAQRSKSVSMDTLGSYGSDYMLAEGDFVQVDLPDDADDVASHDITL
ncbi:prestin-like [Haliotis cracherodii]|uniref:prestin-like n=1 Tax=Haliotis cracherodii TaxID=6455 RepID=UPI0039EB910F